MARKSDDGKEVLIVPLDDYDSANPCQSVSTAVPIKIPPKVFDRLLRRRNGDGFIHDVFLIDPEFSESVARRPEIPLKAFLRQEQSVVHDDTAFSGQFRILNVKNPDLLERFESEGILPAGEILAADDPDKLIANQCCVLKLPSESEPRIVLAIYKPQGSFFMRVPNPYKVEGKISPFTAELAFAHSMLHDSSIGTVTLLGSAGTGKSTMAIHAAVELLLAGEFSSIEIYKSTHQIKGQPPIAAVPGNADQKFASFRKTVETTLQKVLRDLSPRIRACIGNKPPVNGGKGKPNGGKQESQRSYGGLPIQILSPAFLRGEDFEKKCIIIEEAQNFTSDMLLTAGTRLSHQSRLFIVGDQKQVDNPNGNERSNGLIDLVDRLKGRDLYGQVELTVCLRRGVAKMFIDAYYNT